MHNQMAAQMHSGGGTTIAKITMNTFSEVHRVTLHFPDC